MKVLARIRQQIANFVDPTQKQIINKFNQAFLWGMGGGGYTTYDPNADDYIEQGYNINPIVYSVVNQQAVKTSTIPFYIKTIEDEQAYKNLKRFREVTGLNMTAQQKVQMLLMESKAFQEEQLPFPMDRPNVNQNWSEFLALYKTFLKTTGNVYIYMLAVDGGTNAGKPLSIYLLPSHLIQILVKENPNYLALESPVRGYMLIEGNSYMEFEADNVIHIKYSNPNYDTNGSHLYGMAPLRAAYKNIMSSNSALDLNIRTLKSGGAFGFIHGKGSPIQPEQARELKERLVEMNNNPDNLGKVAGVSAEMGFTRISLTSDELKPFDFLNFDQKQICNVLGWSDKLLNNDSGAKYDNINEERKRMVTDNIVPDLKLLEDALNNYFIPRFKGYENAKVEYDVMELPEMQNDAAELSGWLYNGIDKAVFNRDEVRKALRWPEVGTEEMARFTVQNDVISLDEALDNDFSTMPNGSQGGQQDSTGLASKDPNYVPKKKVDTEDKAGFDPNQPRGKGGLWSETGIGDKLSKLSELPKEPDNKKDEHGRFTEGKVHLYHSTNGLENLNNIVENGVDLDKQTAVEGLFFAKLGSPYRKHDSFVILEMDVEDIPWGQRFADSEVAFGRVPDYKLIRASRLSPDNMRTMKSFATIFDKKGMEGLEKALANYIRYEGADNEVSKVVTKLISDEKNKD